MFKSKNLKSKLVSVCSSSLTPSSFVFRSDSPLDSFLHFERLLSDESSSIRIHDDVYLLLNQDRLDKMTQQCLVDYISKNSVSSDSLSSLRKKMSDSQLLKFIKSRYIQAPSDLQNWSKYLEQMADSELSSLREAADATPPSDDSSSDSSNE